jgi:hypothetical protein
MTCTLGVYVRKVRLVVVRVNEFLTRNRLFSGDLGKDNGLGLAITREILAITETGETGKGAWFEIAVPDGMWCIVNELE